MPVRLSSVYLHIGPPKTGTTYLQDVLWCNRDQLTLRGLTYPGARVDSQYFAVLDLRGMRFKGYADPRSSGAWDRLVETTIRAGTPKVVISHELLAGSSEETIAQARHDFPDVELHVVFAARDLARQLPAVWQESIKNRGKSRYLDYLAAQLRDPLPTDKNTFWRSHDPVEVLRRWGAVVPPERIHVITLPQANAPHDTLWQRFCSALDVPPDRVDLDVARRNSSLGRVNAEMLRRLNSALPADLEWPDYELLVKRRFNTHADTQRARDRLTIPLRWRKTVLARALQIRDGIESGGYDVVGDLADLVPASRSFGRYSEVPTDAVANAAIRELAGVMVEKPPTAPARSRVRRFLYRLRG